MGNARSQYGCRFVKYRSLELETKAGREPNLDGVVIIDGMLLVVDYDECNLQVYNRHDGKLITSHRLDNSPRDVCLINKREVAVCLVDGTVVFVSLKSIDDITLVKTLTTRFIAYPSLAKLNSDKLVVSGKTHNDLFMMCWGILSITDGRLDSTHDICIGHWTHIAIKDDTVYISCYTFDPNTNGVYAYNIVKPKTKKFLYQHHKLKRPGSIMTDRDCVYVCDSNIIHQLTDSGQPVTIHTVSSSLWEIFYDDQHGLLYTTSFISNVITVYKMESFHQPEKLHPTVLNRCLPKLMEDLNVRDVVMYMQQKELFDDVIIRDINEQTTTKAITHLIDQLKQRDQDTYDRFKECLVLARRADLKIMLEEEEEKVAAEMK